MIGQSKLQQKIQSMIESDKFPRFSIFIGDKGSGRKTIIRDALKSLGDYQECAIDVDSVREIIEQAYRQITPTVYVFADADNMSVAAKNALLKVTEEPPNNAYFVMTLTIIENTLPTIKSRATVLYMDTYTPAEVVEFYHRVTRGGDEKIIEKYCRCPGDVELVCKYKPKDFNDYVCMVVDNIAVVSGANSFKIGNRLNITANDEDKYDLLLFLKAFRAECLERLREEPLRFIEGINVTTKYVVDLQYASLNKQMLFDNWLLDIRKAWMQ